MGNIAFVLTINIRFVLPRQDQTRIKLKLLIITKG
jgi:hypothetical protein